MRLINHKIFAYFSGKVKFFVTKISQITSMINHFLKQLQMTIKKKVYQPSSMIPAVLFKPSIGGHNLIKLNYDNLL